MVTITNLQWLCSVRCTLDSAGATDKEKQDVSEYASTRIFRSPSNAAKYLQNIS